MAKPFLNEDELAQLKLFAWFLFLVNACMVGLGLFFGHGLEDTSLGLILIGAVAALVNGAFLLIVIGNILVLAIRSCLRRLQGQSNGRVLRSVV